MTVSVLSIDDPWIIIGYLSETHRRQLYRWRLFYAFTISISSRLSRCGKKRRKRLGHVAHRHCLQDHPARSCDNRME